MIQRISRCLNIFLQGKIQIVLFLFLHRTFSFQGPSNSNNEESLLLLFDSLWKVKVRYIVFHLNVLVKSKWNFGKRGQHFATQFWWTRLVVTCLSPIDPVNGLLIVRFRWCPRLEMLVVTIKMPRKKNSMQVNSMQDLEYMQVNVLKIVRRITKRGCGIWTD